MALDGDWSLVRTIDPTVRPFAGALLLWAMRLVACQSYNLLFEFLFNRSKGLGRQLELEAWANDISKSTIKQVHHKFGDVDICGSWHR